MSHSSTSIHDTVIEVAYSQLDEQSPQISENEDGSENGCNETFLDKCSDDRLLPCVQTVTGSLSDESYVATGYQRSCFALFFYHFCSVLLCGSLYLVGYWRPEWKVYWTKKQCPLCQADTLILKDLDGIIHVVSVECQELEGETPADFHFMASLPSGKSLQRFFIFKQIKYIWNVQSGSFQVLCGIDNDVTIQSLLQDYRGYTYDELAIRQKLYGLNAISVEVKTCITLLFTEVLNPFYVFQIASLVLWSADEYYLYAGCVLFISCLCIGLSLYETRQQSENLRMMVESSAANTVHVLRQPGQLKPVECDARDVVPGDVIVLVDSSRMSASANASKATGVLACDAVLISGSAIVNESMLTGESVPVTKTALTPPLDSKELFSLDGHRRHVLFCGTTVMQTRYYGNEQVLAVVLRTGFGTAKGELVRSILSPRQVDFSFYRDSMKFIGFLFCVAVAGMAYSVYLHMSRGKSMLTTVIRSLDLVTIVVPPALPGALTVGTFYAQSRLRKRNIYCVAPPRINVSAKVNAVCFDKTGTLTEDGLEVWGVVPAEEKSHRGNVLSRPERDLSSLCPRRPLAVALATCHSLTFIRGKLSGDPLDVKMFEATKWELVEPEGGDQEEENFDCLMPSLVRPPKGSVAPDQQSPSKTVNFVDILSQDEAIEGACAILDEVDSSVCKNGGMTIEQVPYEIGLVREFPFSSAVQRQSVIVRALGSRAMDFYCKGAPEALRQLCAEESVPSNFDSVLEDYTVRGYRVIALAWRSLEPKLSWLSAQKVHRNQVERDLTFLGLLVLQNVLKPETADVISQLRRARIRTVMVTGDNILTGICVARDCGIVANDEVVLLAKVTDDDCGQKCLTFEETKTGGVPQGNLMGPSLDDVDFGPRSGAGSRVGFRAKRGSADSTISIRRESAYIAISEQSCSHHSRSYQGSTVIEIRHQLEDHSRNSSFKSFTQSGSSMFDTAIITGVSSRPVSPTNEFTALIPNEPNQPPLDAKYHLAISGPVWAQLRQFFPEWMPLVASQATILGRMSPDQKVQLIEALQHLQYVVAMCGDGANDCGALKASHVGVSLSDTEASVASPFTSRIPNVSCIPTILCQGRAALATNFSLFKYMSLYSIIQFITVLILYSACTILSDPQFLYIDLFIVTLITVFMGYTDARHELVKERPLSSLIGAVNLFSVFSQMALVLAGQIFVFVYLKMQHWYTPSSCDLDDPSPASWDTTFLFCTSCLQYLALAVIFSPGRPFRKAFYTNAWLVVSLVCYLCLSSWLLLYPPAFLTSLFQLKPLPMSDYEAMIFRLTILGSSVLHFLLGWSVEYFISGSASLKRVLRCFRQKKEPKNLYKRVLLRAQTNPLWPPIQQPIYSLVPS